MLTCTTCQALLLDYHYGLLDEPERLKIASHLDSCAECRAADTKARTNRELLSAAAKASFPGVEFAPPPLQIASAPTVKAAPRPRRQVNWAVWGIAASVLLLVGGFGVTLAMGYVQHSNEIADNLREQSKLQTIAQLEAEKARNEQVRLQDEMRAVQEQIQLIEKEWKEEAQKVQKKIADSDVQLSITGPKSVMAGALNKYQIETQRSPMGGVGGKGNPRVSADPSAPAKLTIQAVDAKSKKLVFTETVQSKGLHELVLPRDLPVTPGSQLQLQVYAEYQDGKKINLSEELTLSGPLYQTHLMTDRPMYRPGEKVYFRSLTLERFSLKPAQDELQLRFTVNDPNQGLVFQSEGSAQVRLSPEVAQGNRAIDLANAVKPAPELARANADKPLGGPDGQPLRGVGCGEWLIPVEAPGGEYTLTISDVGNRFPPERRKFLVNKYQAPRLNKELEFTRKSYGPGETVVVQAKAARVEGGLPVANRPVIATATVDGNPCAIDNADRLTTDQTGAVLVKVQLPKQMERGQGTLSLQFTDGANLETLVRPIPIVLNKLFIEFFPEGGDLVAGISNRVYFHAKTTLNKPAEVLGHIVDEAGKEVVAVRTLADDAEAGVNQGMGLFEFTPVAGKKYELKIATPLNITSKHALPNAKKDGLVLSVASGVFTDRLDVTVTSSAQARKLLVGAYCRGRLLDHANVVVEPGKPTALHLKPAEGVAGVYRVTVFEERAGAQLVPVAERLVYRRPTQQLKFTVEPDKSSYSPGETVQLQIRAANELGIATPVVAVVNVIDQSILKLADEKTTRTLPTHFFLTTEVRQPEDLEYADFLVSDHPKAPAALDLLLGTQGWRRFAEQIDPRLFRQQQPQEADRLLLAYGQATPQRNESGTLQVAKVDQQFAPKYLALQTVLAEKEAAEELQQQVAVHQKQQLDLQIENARQQSVHFRRQEESYRNFLTRLATIGMGLLLVVLTLGGLALGVWRLAQRQAGGLRFVAAGLCSLMLFVGGLGVVLLTESGAELRRPFAMNDERNEMVKARRAEAVAVDEAKAVGALMDGDLARKDKAMDFAVPANMPGPDALLLQRGGQQGVPPLPKLMPQGDLLAEQVGRRLLAPPPVAAPPAGAMAAVKKPMAMGFNRFQIDGAEMGERRFLDAGARKQDFEGLGLAERDLRKEGNFREIARFRMALDPKRLANLPAIPQPFAVREYSHRHESNPDGVRRDFTETLCWHPVLVLPGEQPASIFFDLSDAVTRFQVQVVGHSLDGRLGAFSTEIASRLPFNLDAKIPMEVTNTDKVILPLSIANDTAQARLVDVTVQATNLSLVGPASKQLEIAANQRQRQLFTFDPLIPTGQAKVRFTGTSLPFGSDAVERSFNIVPEGFPIVANKSDLLEKTATHVVKMPDSWVSGTLQMQVEVFPSTLADLQRGLEQLLREPNGCFEQTSSSNYPNIMILSYLKESDQANPNLEKRARGLLADGYGKLTSFECIDPKDTKKHGYEWFGGTAPAHEALTAYGLLQFKDMAGIHPVDPQMLQRTHKYLLDQRDGKGGFKRNARALDSFGRAPVNITNAYIVWALTSFGDDDLSKELTTLHEQAKKSQDPYFLSLVALGLLNRGQSDDALALLKTVKEKQKGDGAVEGAETSITASGGRDLQIETTALALLAWLKANRPEDFTLSVQKAAKWIGQQRGGYGGFGSTQSTILALKALIAFTRENRKVAEDTDLILFVNEKEVARKHFAAGQRDGLVIAAPEKVLQPGDNVVRVEMSKNSFPFTLTWSYRTLQPANPAKCPVEMSAKLDRNDAKEGETLNLKVKVENKSGKDQGMAVAVVGLPGGLSIPPDMRHLKELCRPRDNETKPGLISAFEIRGRELVLYWRAMKKDEKIEVELPLVAQVPGEYRGPASRSYLYYNADHRFWTEPLAVNIRPE